MNYKWQELTVRIVLDENGDFFGRLGQLVGGLLSCGLSQVDPVVLQDLVGTSQANLKQINFFVQFCSDFVNSLTKSGIVILPDTRLNQSQRSE